ncbi:MAG: sulfatase-like hydrolase/transferase [Polyangiaceae bacterium]|nr:sulfatase-like hydrolase/transferase [Polyangiaceae bacterium]
MANQRPASAAPRPRPARSPRGARFLAVLDVTATGIGAAWLVLALELCAVTLLGQRRFASVWEIQFGSLWLAPTALGLAGACGVAGAGLGSLLRRDSLAARRLFASLIGLGATAAAWSVGGGRHLAEPVKRFGFAAVVGLVGGLAVLWIAARAARLARTRPWVLRGLGWLVVVACEVVNASVLVRLYPGFHASLAITALLLAAATAVASRAESASATPRKYRLLGYFGVWVMSLALATLSAQRLSTFDNYRMVLLDRAPLLGQAVLVAGRLAPPPPISADCDGADCWRQLKSEGLSREARGASSLDWRGHDVLLISIDALRADHVGAYGYERTTTQHIDALATGDRDHRGVVFNWAYCPTPHTSYSVTSLMTGKYMRPLLLQGAGADSDTWAGILRTYGFRTAAFYPPAVFFIDGDRFQPFMQSQLGFEYAKQEFLEGEGRVKQVTSYLDGQQEDQRLFVWVHLFGPHEPYEAHPGLGFGDRDIDRYDSEIAAADRTVGQLVEAMRKRRPGSIVIVTSDHGEEFGDHGGRYHGSSVYEEQVRVPLVVSIPEQRGSETAASPPKTSTRVNEVVQTIDLLPTVLGALDVPIPPRVRGRDLSPVIAAARKAPAKDSRPAGGFALVETDAQSLLAEGSQRLICERRLGACQLFDLNGDPQEKRPVDDPTRREALQKRLKQLGASHGRFEQSGRRAEGKGWPAAILRGMSGDGDAAPEIAALLDDADVEIRRKAAEILFELGRAESASSLELAVRRDEDERVKRWSALALTRLGRGAPLTFELVKGDDSEWRRLAALALAESGDKRGEAILIAWWKDEEARDFTRSQQILAALGHLRSEDAVWPFVQSLDDVRLRPYIARALAQIGEDVARVPLAKALSKERYQSARVALTESLVELGATAELVEPLKHFLGVPDPLAGGVGFAREAKILDRLGGPDGRHLAKLEKQAGLGVQLLLVVPKGGNGKGVRALVRAQSEAGGKVYIGPEQVVLKYDRHGVPRSPKDLPRINYDQATVLEVPASTAPVEVWSQLGDAVGAKPGKPVNVVVFAERGVSLLGLALVPLSDELPPPPPKPWKPGQKEE